MLHSEGREKHEKLSEYGLYHNFHKYSQKPDQAGASHQEFYAEIWIAGGEYEKNDW